MNLRLTRDMVHDCTVLVCGTCAPIIYTSVVQVFCTRRHKLYGDSNFFTSWLQLFDQPILMQQAVELHA